MARPGPRHPAGRRPLLAAALLALALVVGAVLRASADGGATPAAAGGPVSEPPGPSASADATAPSTALPSPPADAERGAEDGAVGTAPAGDESPAGEESTTAGASPGSGLSGDGTGSTTRPEATGSPADSSGTGTPSGEPPRPAVDTAAVLAALTDAGARAGGTVQAVVLGPDGTELVASPGAGDQLWTASLSKTLLVSQLLDADGGPVPGPDDLRLVERALTSSDDQAMNTLWTRFDGPALIAETAADFGLTGTAPPSEIGQWGEATTTARDYARFLDGLADALDPAAQASLTGWLQSTTPTAADGFDQVYGLLAPAVAAGAPVSAKQGWMCCVDSRRQLHSAGSLVDGRVVVLLGDFPSSTGWAAARTALDEAAQAVVAGTAG